MPKTSIALALDAAVRAVEPLIDGVSVGDVADKATWEIHFQPGATNQALANAALSAFAFRNVVPFDVFIGRFTGPEYLLMQQKRTVSGALCQQWDISMVRGTVDLNSAAAQNFKAALVSSGILSQTRADLIFS